MPPEAGIGSRSTTRAAFVAPLAADESDDEGRRAGEDGGRHAEQDEDGGIDAQHRVMVVDTEAHRARMCDRARRENGDNGEDADNTSAPCHVK